MTAKELAALIDGREAGQELTVDEAQEVKESGLVALYTPFADRAVLTGAIMDCARVYPYQHEHLYIYLGGFLPVDGCGCHKRYACPFFTIAMNNTAEIGVEVHTKDPEYYCKFSADIPHETFRTYIGNGAEAYCVGLVFRMEDLPS